MKTCDCNQGRLPCTCKMSPKLGNAVRRLGIVEPRPNEDARAQALETFITNGFRVRAGLAPIMGSDGYSAYPAVPLIESPDDGTVKELKARNLRLKMEINRLNEMLNDRDELIDGYRNPKPLKWVCAAVLVGLVFLANHYGFM